MAVEIILDAGHGGFDNGATYDGEREKDQVLRLTKDVGQRLMDDGYVVKYTRTTDDYDSPYQKAERANELGGDYFLSFHRNFSVEDDLYHGVQSLVYSTEATKAVELGEALNARLEEVGFDNLGIEAVQDLIVLRETDMPAVLLEVGFMNSQIDRQIWETRYPEIVDGIVAAIEDVAPIVVNQQMQSNGYYVQTGLFKYDVNAAYQLERLTMLGYEGVIHYEKPFYGVWVGPFETLEDAVMMQNRLRKAGYRTLIVST